MFGFEESIDSRFVQLDCDHIFESRGLDKYMLSFQKGEVIPVKYKTCPECVQPILTTKRYMSQINRVLNDINSIKTAFANQKRAVNESVGVI